MYQRPCTAVLGDTSCRFDVAAAGYQTQFAIAQVDDQRVCEVGRLDEFESGWFARGQMRIVSGQAEGLGGLIKRDWVDEHSVRRIELWEEVRSEVAVGDRLQLTAGCDKHVFNVSVQVFEPPQLSGLS